MDREYGSKDLVQYTGKNYNQDYPTRNGQPHQTDLQILVNLQAEALGKRLNYNILKHFFQNLSFYDSMYNRSVREDLNFSVAVYPHGNMGGHHDSWLRTWDGHKGE